MGNVTKCANKECPRSNDCYRYLAKDNDVWPRFECNEHGNCEFFMKIK